MGVPRQNTIDLKSYPNDKDLTQKQRYRISTQKTKSQFPDYVKPFLKQYICLLGINQEFGYLNKELYFEDVEKGSLKKREKFIDRLYNYIKKYGEAVKSGFFKDLSEEELTPDVFLNIEHIEMSLDEFLENYLEPCTEDDDEYEYDDCIYKLNKQKYEIYVDKDYPGLRKLIDTLSLYNETIKYEKIYPKSETTSCSNINYSSESESESEDEDNQDILDFIENEDDEITSYEYGSDTEIGASDISDFDSDSDSD